MRIEETRSSGIFNFCAVSSTVNARVLMPFRYRKTATKSCGRFLEILEICLFSIARIPSLTVSSFGATRLYQSRLWTTGGGFGGFQPLIADRREIRVVFDYFPLL